MHIYYIRVFVGQKSSHGLAGPFAWSFAMWQLRLCWAVFLSVGSGGEDANFQAYSVICWLLGGGFMQFLEATHSSLLCEVSEHDHLLHQAYKTLQNESSSKTESYII